MQRRLSEILGALACFAVVGLGTPAARAAEKPAAPAALPDLSGRWALNKDLSDDAREKLREQMERGGRGGPGLGGPGMGGSGMGGRMGPPRGGDDGDDAQEAMKPILQPAEEITIYQGQGDLVIEEQFARRRTLHADGRKYKADNGRSEVKTEWKEGRLVVETRGFRGRRTTETWELSTTGKRLTALTKLENGFGGKATVSRVYDRLAPSASAEPDQPEPPPQD